MDELKSVHSLLSCTGPRFDTGQGNKLDALDEGEGGGAPPLL